MKMTPESGNYAIRIARTLVCAVLFCGFAGIAASQDYTWQVESSLTYETGKYGTDQSTDLIYVPVSLRRFLSQGDVTLTVPYVDLKTGGGVTVIDGAVVPGSGTGGSGLGDISVKGRYNWIEQGEVLPFIDLIARVKIPTADEDKGLGTGEFDMGFGAELSRRFGKDYIGFADLTYTFIGDPPNVNYDNRIDADLGLGYQFTPELMGSVSYDYRSAISDGGTDAHSLLFLGNYRFTPQLRTYAMFEVGLSDGAPDYGVTVGAAYRF